MIISNKLCLPWASLKERAHNDTNQRTHVRACQRPRRLTVTVSASEEETYYVQSTSVALGSDFSRISRARRGTRKKRNARHAAPRHAAPRHAVPYRSIQFRPMTHSREAPALSRCESRPERNVIKGADRIALFVKFRKKERKSRELSARNRVSRNAYPPTICFYRAQVNI